VTLKGVVRSDDERRAIKDRAEGVAFGALAIPGFGPFIAAGPIMGALAGVGAGGVVGGLLGALIGMEIPEYEAKRYEGMVKEGRALVRPLRQLGLGEAR
jgi:hypothetical protein